tara:strand:- start:5205 stop:5729 length:525 start_codon:yes stop_codon:yes gene_type:complete
MTLEELIISFVRITASLIVFKFNFFGAILVILIDFSDLFMMNLISLGGVRNYQFLDKFLDLFYIGYFLLITLRWEKILRNISILLFIFRMLGFILFEFFQNRIILFIFPNIFEFWFICITLLFLFRSKISKRKIIIVIFLSTILKLIQEYILHVWKVLDNYRAVDVFNSFVELF